MDIQKIEDSLSRKFYPNEGQKNPRIVFWYDAEREFEGILRELSLANITVLNLAEEPALALKIKLESEEPDSRFLLYAPYAKPENEDNWLLDIEFYSGSPFYADPSSMLILELGLDNLALRSFFSKNKDFFKAKVRRTAIQKIIDPFDEEDELKLKMLAVLTNADEPIFESCLFSIFASISNKRDMSAGVSYLESFKKYQLEKFFWSQIQARYGYEGEKSIAQLLFHLLCTDLMLAIGDEPSSIKHFSLIANNKARNVQIFLNLWRSNRRYCYSYHQIAGLIEGELKISEIISDLSLETLTKAMTFEKIEFYILSDIKNELMHNNSPDFEQLGAFIEERLHGFWCTLKNDDSNNKSAEIESAYKALVEAGNLLILRQKHPKGFDYQTPEQLVRAYRKELFLFDRYYRHFCEYFDLADCSWDLLKDLKEKVEDIYSSWFLNELSIHWKQFLENGLIDSWGLEGIESQNRFYEKYVKKSLGKSSNSKVFVIISDALRYEVAQELLDEVNRQNYHVGELDCMLGVLPSITSLGMASLLPHDVLSIKQTKNGFDVLADGQSTAGLKNRATILGDVQGFAMDEKTFMSLKKDELRDKVRNSRVVYIYHNTIDDRGDKASSENETFQACREAIDQILRLVKKIVGNIGVGRIFITADHGFLYSHSDLKSYDRTEIKPPDDVYNAKKRYILGKDLPENTNVWKGSTNVSASMPEGADFWLPKGINRFHFVGGARFLHGGAMPQEVLIPLVSVKTQRSEDAKTRKVAFELLGSRKIANNIHILKFCQTEEVSEKILARSIKMVLKDGDELISNQEMLSFDSSDVLGAASRNKTVKLRLAKRSYDRRKDYCLVISDAQTHAQIEAIIFKIDLTIATEF
jgi:uncharacterized protein (TIGR02687 family)